MKIAKLFKRLCIIVILMILYFFIRDGNLNNMNYTVMLITIIIFVISYYINVKLYDRKKLLNLPKKGVFYNEK